MLNAEEERCEKGVVLCNVSGGGWMWDGSLVTWACEETGMRCWAWGGIRIRQMGWVNIWEQVKELVFLRGEGEVEPQSITELLRCGLVKGLEDCVLA